MKIKAKQIDFTSHPFVNPIEIDVAQHEHTYQSPHDLLYITYDSGTCSIQLPDHSTLSPGTIVSIKRLTSNSANIEAYTGGTIEGSSSVYTLNNDTGVCFVLLNTSGDWAGLSIFH